MIESEYQLQDSSLLRSNSVLIAPTSRAQSSQLNNGDSVLLVSGNIVEEKTIAGKNDRDNNIVSFTNSLSNNFPAGSKMYKLLNGQKYSGRVSPGRTTSLGYLSAGTQVSNIGVITQWWGNIYGPKWINDKDYFYITKVTNNSWNVKLDDGTHFDWRSSSDISSYNDGEFTISSSDSPVLPDPVGAPSIEGVTPNQPTTLYINNPGSSPLLQYILRNPRNGNVHIYLQNSSGNIIGEIKNISISGPFSNTWIPGFYSWQPPYRYITSDGAQRTVAPGNGYKIVYGFSYEDSGASIQSVSSGSFSFLTQPPSQVVTFQVISPKQGEQYKKNSTMKIRIDCGNCFGKIILYLHKDNMFVQRIGEIETNAADVLTRTYNWVIPTNLTVGSGYQVSANATILGGLPSTTGHSGYFSITNDFVPNSDQQTSMNSSQLANTLESARKALDDILRALQNR